MFALKERYGGGNVSFDDRSPTVPMSCFISALDLMRPSVTEFQRKRYEALKTNFDVLR